MTRAEHLQWCKDRALEYLDRGDVTNAIASMMSDLRKHPDTEDAASGPFVMLGMMAIRSGNASEARRFIVGFN